MIVNVALAERLLAETLCVGSAAQDTVAVKVAVPAVAPEVKVEVACPLASVFWDVGDNEPEVVEKDTLAP